MSQDSLLNRIRGVLYELLERRDSRSRVGRLLDFLLVSLITVNILASVVESMHGIAEPRRTWLDALLYCSLGVFALEYLARLWVCTCDPDGVCADPVYGRLRYALSPLAMLDLLAVLPLLLGVAAGLDLRFLRLARVLWLLRVGRYLPAMGMLGRVLRRERRTLAAVFTMMLVALFIISSLVYVVEREHQPGAFSSIPQSMWWGIVTLTTVGYGDLVPQSQLGRALAMVIMLMGIVTFALPAGLLASAFAEERRRRDFMLSWNLVAQVPAFERLSAREIADIAALLHPREVMAKEVMFHRGDEADRMYFIVSGELEVEIQPEPIRMRTGEYFGEVGLIYHQPRTASVVAVTRAELLELYANDLERLFAAKPQLRAQILAHAEQRLANTPPDPTVATVPRDPD